MAPRTRQQAARELVYRVLFGDLSADIQKSLPLKDLLALRRCCNQALNAAVFKPEKALALLNQYGTENQPTNLAGLAVRNGDLPLLEFAVRRGCDTTLVCYYAVALGNFKILQWARAQDPPCAWGHAVSCCAGLRNRLKILQWMRNQDPPCPWNEWTVLIVTEMGHYDMLKWMRAQNPPCPWDYEKTCQQAVRHTEIYQWLLQNP